MKKEANHEKRLGKVAELDSVKKIFVYLTNPGYNPCGNSDCT